MKQIVFDAERGEAVLGEAAFDGLDIPYPVAKRLSDYCAMLHFANYYDAYFPRGSDMSEEEMEQWLDEEENRLMVELRKALPHVEFVF